MKIKNVFTEVTDKAGMTGLYILYAIGNRIDRLGTYFQISALNKTGQCFKAKADQWDDRFQIALHGPKASIY